MEIKPSAALLGTKGDGLSCHEPLKTLVVQWKQLVMARIHLLINFALLVLSLSQPASSASLCCKVTGEKQLSASASLVVSPF